MKKQEEENTKEIKTPAIEGGTNVCRFYDK